MTVGSTDLRGIIQVRRVPSPFAPANPMQIHIDGMKVGSLMMSQTGEYPVSLGEHLVQVKMLLNPSSNVMRVAVSTGSVVALLCRMKPPGAFRFGGPVLEFDKDSQSPIDQPTSLHIVLHDTQRVRAGVEDVAVPPGVTIRVSRSRTVEHSIEYTQSDAHTAELATKLGTWLQLSIRKHVEQNIGKALKESETVSYEIELNGSRATKYQLAWTDIWRLGTVTIKEGASSPFRFREGAELEVVALS